MRWIKVVSNTGTAFLTTLSGLLTIEGLTGGAIPLDLLLSSSLLISALQGGLAFFRELSKQDSERKEKKGCVGIGFRTPDCFRTKLNIVLDNMLLW